MTALLIVVAAIVLLFIGYVFYGSWLAKQWGIDPTKKTPAIEKEDGVDYVAAKPAVLMGHHFSSIAGAGPINGPIQASIFGWVPVFLWCIIGGIFFGGLQDFGSLFASIRHDGKSVGEIIEDSMGSRAKKLFIIFALLVLILVIASFVNIVAGTFLTLADDAGKTAFGFVTNPTGNQSTAMISLLFIVLAIIYGYVTNRMGVKTLPATIGGIIGIVAITVLGLNVGFAMNRIAWIVFVGVYIAVASLVPVWILLQPRDYLSSFLLYAMIGLAFVGVVAGAFTGTVAFDIPAFNGWEPKAGQTLFPMLFITVACGACSGFHSLIATGTSSKQLASEKDAKAIGYGSMLVESFTAVIALIAAITISQGVYFSTNMSASQISTASGVTLTVTSTPDEQAEAAVKAVDSMKVSDIEGNQMKITWDSVDENGNAKTYEGADALKQAASDIGENTIVSRTGGATTFAMGMANFLKSYLGGHDSMAFWYHFAIMFEALFILTTVDNGTRVARYQIGELLGNVRKLKKFADPTWKPGNIITTLIATALWGGLLWVGVCDTNGGINAMMPIFGISNQLLAAACFMLVTVCVAKLGYKKYLWIPVVPLVWDVAVTFTADFQKIVGPISYFATASKYQALIDGGALEGEALVNAKAALSNAYLDGVLSVFFMVMMGVFLVVGIYQTVKILAKGKFGVETTSEEPFVESEWFAPSSLIATKLEKKVQREYAAKSYELAQKEQAAA